MAVPINPSLTIPEAELRWRFSTSGGPGGQHANRASTRVELLWSPAQSAVLDDWQKVRLVERLGPEVIIAVDSHRSQLRNRSEAKQRLGQRCQQALATTRKRKATKPSAGAVRRRLKQKNKRSKTKKLRKRPPSF